MSSKFDNILKTLNEYVEYSDDEQPISVVIPDDHHDYERVGGVLYELSSNAHNEILFVSEIEHTDENQFYQNQIDAYVEYIRDGGVLESFPVIADPKPSRREILNKMEEDFDWVMEMYDDYQIEEAIDVDVVDFDDFVLDVYLDGGLGDIINSWDFTEDPEDYYDLDDPEIEEAKTLIPKINALVKKIDEIIEGENIGVYTLTDMNHRFAAIKELGIDRVWAEIV